MFKLSTDQIKIKDFIIQHYRCNIFAGCGKGKTLATLCALQEIEDFPVLVVAPLRVASFGWSQQAEQFGIDFTFSHIIGSELKRLESFNKEADIYIINYENLNWLSNTLNFKFKTVICDEATKIKNHQVYLTKNNLRSIKGRNSTALVKHCVSVKRWINLTATPVHNHIKDIWGLQFPIDFGKALGSNRQVFLDKYFNAYRFKSHLPATYTPKFNAKNNIIKKIKPTTLFITDSINSDTEIINIKITLPKEVLKEYKKLQKEKCILSPKNELIIDHVGIKQRQFTSGFVLGANGIASRFNEIKQKALLDLLEIIEGSVIIVYQFKEEAKILQEILPNARRLDENTEKTLSEWNRGDIKYLLIHPLSAGHGVNLQHGGNKMVFYSNDWNGELFSQTIERIGSSRQKLSGYNRKTYIYRFITKETIEDRIIKKIERKLKDAI